MAVSASRGMEPALPGGHAGPVISSARFFLAPLHELAHHLTDPSVAAHGREFVGTLLDLVDGVVGAEAAFLLRVRLADEGAEAG